MSAAALPRPTMADLDDVRHHFATLTAAVTAQRQAVIALWALTFFAGVVLVALALLLGWRLELVAPLWPFGAVWCAALTWWARAISLEVRELTRAATMLQIAATVPPTPRESGR